MAELSTKALRELYDNPELVDAVVEPCACGAPRTLALGLNTLVCTDIGCPFRVAARLYAIAERYQMTHLVKLLDLEYLCQERYYRSWLDFFTDELGDTEFEEFQTKLLQAIKSEVDVPTIMMMSGFDVLTGDQIYNLCGDFQSVSDLASVLDSDGFIFIAERLGLTAAHLVPAAVHIYNRLAAGISEMLEAEEVFCP